MYFYSLSKSTIQFFLLWISQFSLCFSFRFLSLSFSSHNFPFSDFCAKVKDLCNHLCETHLFHHGIRATNGFHWTDGFYCNAIFIFSNGIYGNQPLLLLSNMMTVKLDSSNYTIWKHQISMVLETYFLFELLDDTQPIPEKFLKDLSGSVTAIFNPDY